MIHPNITRAAGIARAPRIERLESAQDSQEAGHRERALWAGYMALKSLSGGSLAAMEPEVLKLALEIHTAWAHYNALRHPVWTR